MTVVFTNFGKESPIIPIQLGWTETTLFGHPYAFRLRPNRATTFAEQQTIREFCSARFPQEDWFLFKHDKHETLVGFRRADHRTLFVKDFNVG